MCISHRSFYRNLLVPIILRPRLLLLQVNRVSYINLQCNKDSDLKDQPIYSQCTISLPPYGFLMFSGGRKKDALETNVLTFAQYLWGISIWCFNPLTLGVHQKVIHSLTNLLLSAARCLSMCDLFNEALNS